MCCLILLGAILFSFCGIILLTWGGHRGKNRDDGSAREKSVESTLILRYDENNESF